MLKYSKKLYCLRSLEFRQYLLGQKFCLLTVTVFHPEKGIPEMQLDCNVGQLYCHTGKTPYKYIRMGPVFIPYLQETNCITHTCLVL